MKAIELGGGSNPIYRPNIDIRQLPNVDIVIDLNNPLPISGEEYDFVYSKYLLEHISWRNVKNFIREIYRILKPDGKIEIITSNLLEQAKVLVNTKEWGDNLIGMVFGDQNFNENAHQSGFSPEHITKILNDIGFINIKISPIQSDFGPTDMIIKAAKSNVIDTEIIKEYKNTKIESIKTEPIKTYSGNIDRQQWILGKCELGKKILDIGSQDGHTFINTPFRPYVTSVDLDRYDFPGFVQMDAHNLQFPDKSFDIAVLGEILEHVDDPITVLREAKRAARRVIITVPDEWNWDKSYYPFETIEQGAKRKNQTIEQMAKEGNPTAKEFYTKDNHKHLFHNRHYTEETLKQDLDKAGIKDYEMIRLQYNGWSFFTVDIVSENIIKDPVAKGPIISTGPVIPSTIIEGPIITEGPIFDTKHPLSRNIPLRIALISTPFFGVPPKQYGGLEQIVWDLAEALDVLGHEVTIFAPEGSQKTKNGFLVEIGKPINIVNVNWFEQEKKAYEIYKDIITPDRFDLVHDHTWFGFPYLLKSKYHTLKVLSTHHGGFNWESPPNW